MKKKCFALLFLLLSSIAFGDWTEVFKNDAHGRTLSGSFDSLVEAVQSGYAVRVKLGGDPFLTEVANSTTYVGDCREVFISSNGLLSCRLFSSFGMGLQKDTYYQMLFGITYSNSGDVKSEYLLWAGSNIYPWQEWPQKLPLMNQSEGTWYVDVPSIQTGKISFFAQNCPKIGWKQFHVHGDAGNLMGMVACQKL